MEPVSTPYARSSSYGANSTKRNFRCHFTDGLCPSKRMRHQHVFRLISSFSQVLVTSAGIK